MTEAARVLTHERFNVDAARLRDLGVDVETKFDASEFDLPLPETGFPVLGSLEGYEIALFAEGYRVSKEAEGLERSITGDALMQAGERLKEGKPALDQLMKHLPEQLSGPRKQLWSLRQRWKASHALLHYLLGERFNAHDKRLGVRAGFRVVVLGDRFE